MGTSGAAVFSKRNLTIAAVLFCVALLFFMALELRFGINPIGVSAAPYQVYQAESLLHGRWNLHLPATMTTDVEAVGGKQYIYYPPMPAVLLMPLVAIWGHATSDIFFTTLLSAGNLPLLYLVLEQARANGWDHRLWIEHLAMCLLLYLGSITVWLSLDGGVWNMAHIVCMTCTLLALLAAFRRRYGLAAVCLGGAFFSRYTAVVGFPLLFYLAWWDQAEQHPFEQVAAKLRIRRMRRFAFPPRRLVAPAVVTLAVVGLFLAHNAAAFGLPLDTGYAVLTLKEHPELRYGVFNLRYVPSNVVSYFFSLPHIIYNGPFDLHPRFDMMNTGTRYDGFDGGIAVGVFFTTPLFLYLFWRNRRFNPLRAMLWLTLALLLGVLLPFFSIGSYQFGARFLYDGYAYAFLLVALNDVRVDWRFALLGILGIVVNCLGAMQRWTGIIPHL